MDCITCGNKVKPGKVCKKCGTQNPKRPKTNKLGNCAIIFSFFIPIVGLILGIIALVVGIKGMDKTLKRDGIVSIIMSVVVSAVWATLIITFIMIGWAGIFVVLSVA